MKSKTILAALGLALIAAPLPTALAAGPAKPAATAKPAAPAGANVYEVLKGMSDKLAGAKVFSFKANREVNATIAAARNLQATTAIDVIVQRPNSVVGSSTNADGVRRMYYDGTTFTMLDAKENMYASVALLGTLDSLPGQLASKFGFVPPLADFVISNPYQDMRLRAKTITYSGTEMAGTPAVECHHIALSGSAANSELWIAVSDNLPRKMTATVKGATGTQLTIDFTEWNLNATVTPETFVFTPPKDSQQIPMVTTAEMQAAAKAK